MEEHFGNDERAKSIFTQTLKIEKYDRTYTELKNPNHEYKGFHIGGIVYMSRTKKKRNWKDKPKSSKDGVYIITGMLASQRRLKLKNLKGEELTTSMKYCRKLETRGCITIHNYDIMH